MYKIKPAITCSQLTIEILEQGVKYVFIVNFEHISHLVLVFLLLFTEEILNGKLVCYFPFIPRFCNIIVAKEEKRHNIPANIYLFKVNNRNTRKRFEMCSKSTISHLLLVFLLITLNK